jgi:ribosomal protein L37AE/L43A
MAKLIKVANHKYICPNCKGNGYTKVYDMIIQCDRCKSQGELTLEEPTIEELDAMAHNARHLSPRK